MLALFALELALVLMISKLVITGHEGDLLHMLDATLRMVDGERPHVDFMTPIGILGFAPVAMFLAAGFAVGKATLLASVAMLAVMLPAVWWVGVTRLSKGQAYAFGAVIVFLMTAVVYGGSSSVLSLSMYYNRWGWAITFLVLVTAVFPAKRDLAENMVAPLLIGSGMAALLMLKVTFFAPLLPALPVLLLVQKRGGILVRAVVVALGIGVGLVGWLGVDYFLAYLDDLLTLTHDISGRTRAGSNLFMVVLSPNGLVATLVLFGSLFMFRTSRQDEQGLVLFILAPVFIYITYQNWGNDPKWLLFVALYLWANMPEEGVVAAFALPARQSAFALSIAAMAVIFPSLTSLANTPFRAVLADSSKASFLALTGGRSDIWVTNEHMKTIENLVSLEGWPRMNPDSVIEINGFTFPDCQTSLTLVPVYKAMAQEITALDFTQGQPVLTADVLNAGWLLADMVRVPGAAPWYYGDGAGVENAAYLAVPMCPLKPNLRTAMVRQVQQAGYGLEEVYRSGLVVLYAMAKPAE